MVYYNCKMNIAAAPSKSMGIRLSHSMKVQQLKTSLSASKQKHQENSTEDGVTYKDWHGMLPYTLHGYRTSIRTSTGATPYSLVYGTEAVLPIEVEIPSSRVIAEAELEDAEWIQSWRDQLNLIEEKRLTALCHKQLYQKRIKSAFDRKLRPH
ncbi:hypothetical protein CR513_13879, partial [Mucuna pruriens]